MTPEDEKQFIAGHRLCIVGHERQAGPPALSPVYYVLDGDDILISTQADRAKARAIQRNPEVSLCILDENPPFPYVTVFGTGRIESEGAAELMMRVGEAISGKPVPESGRAAIEERARREQRVVLRVTPVSTFATGPRARPKE